MMEPGQEPSLSSEVIERLAMYGVQQNGEVELRRLLESHAQTYTLYRLAPAAARKWKARYRIMIGATYLDCQSAAEAYARALLLTLDEPTQRPDHSPSPHNP
jgi:hypothetical protein